VGIEYKEDGTELLREYVVRRGTALTSEDIYKYSAERVAKYKRLDRGVVLVDSIPKTSSGEILKQILRERAKARLQDKYCLPLAKHGSQWGVTSIWTGNVHDTDIAKSSVISFLVSLSFLSPQ
jgi:hypothetical protein